MKEVTRAGTVIIVEGQSDKVALETLARRRGLVLAGAGVEITAIGGAHAIGRFGRLTVVACADYGDATLAAASATSARSPTSGEPSSAPASAATWTAPAWSASASTSASPTSRTS